MEDTLLSKKEIAELFSTGKFEATFPYLAEEVTWKIAGDKQLNGKSEVMSICKDAALTESLSQSIMTTEQVIKDDNKVVIKGSGEFIRHGKKVRLVAACDIYEFNADDQVERISSYCIEER